MYSIGVIGDTPTARAVIKACHQSGFNDLTWVQTHTPGATLAAHTLPANVTKVLNALDGATALNDYGHRPDRQQVRLARSGFLLSELPLGQFAKDRYGAELINIEGDCWPQLLPWTSPPSPAATLTDLERQYEVVIVCDEAFEAPSEPPQATHGLWHASVPFEQDTSKVNITWVGEQYCAWQFSTPKRQHIYFSLPVGHAPSDVSWHPLLGSAVALAVHQNDFCATQSPVREHWQTGSVVYLGSACLSFNPYLREASTTGLEDAWVLSRMLENYEEDIHDGLAAYERYRRARARRIAKAATATAHQMNKSHMLARGLQHLNTALSTRFLPEIAMNRIDWFYGYDAIRGFR